MQKGLKALLLMVGFIEKEKGLLPKPSVFIFPFFFKVDFAKL